MIYSPYHLYSELLTQKYIGVFESLSKIKDNIKIEILCPENPRNVILSIGEKGKPIPSFFFKQPKIGTIENSDPFDNEVNFYQCFYHADNDFFYNRYKKYLLLPWIDKDKSQELIFFDGDGIFQADDTKSYIEKCVKTINAFHQKSNIEVTKKLFENNSYSSIKPLYKNILQAYKKAYKANRFNEIFFANDCEKERKGVRILIANFLREDSIVDFFIELLDNHIFDNNYLIHGDMKMSNLRGDDDFKIIDFEFVCFGDRLWDCVCFVESVLQGCFADIYDNIYEIRFSVLIQFIKGFLGQKLCDKKNDIYKYLTFLIVHKLVYIIDDNSAFSTSEPDIKDTISSISNLIKNRNEFVELIIKGEFNDSCIPYLLSAGCSE